MMPYSQKALLILFCVLVLVYSGCRFNINDTVNNGEILDFGIKHAHEPNCDAIYLITKIENCETLKRKIQPDSIRIVLKGGCFDSVEFSYPAPNIRHMYSNTFSITLRTCSYITFSQDRLDSLAKVWKPYVQVEIKFQNKEWILISNN